jgi:hypothetical protein
MPKIIFRGEERPHVGQHIVVRIAFGATIGAVFKVLTLTGEVIAKARVKKDFSKDDDYKAHLFVDPRRDDDNPGHEWTNLGKNLFDLEVEKTNDDEKLY